MIADMKPKEQFPVAPIINTQILNNQIGTIGQARGTAHDEIDKKVDNSQNNGGTSNNTIQLRQVQFEKPSLG